MTSSDRQSDDELLSELREALDEAALVPQNMMRDAKALHTWITVDEDLERLSLLFDSLVHETGLVRGVATADTRSLIFQGKDIGLEAEIHGSVIMGQIFPVQSAVVTVMTPSETVATVTTDDLGRFKTTRPAVGPVRLHWQNEHVEIVTEWLWL